MKTVNLRCVFIILVSTLNVFISHQVIAKTMDEKPIHLIPPDHWGGETSRSITIQPAVSASIDGSLLHIQCTSPTVDVTVCIIQNGMIVHQETIPATDTNHILVDLSNYVEGVYTLDLTNSAGGHVWGEFER